MIKVRNKNDVHLSRAHLLLYCRTAAAPECLYTAGRKNSEIRTFHHAGKMKRVIVIISVFLNFFTDREKSIETEQIWILLESTVRTNAYNLTSTHHRRHWIY